MNRVVLLATGAASLVLALVLGWIDVRQEREYRRLIVAGDSAVAADQTFVAIEAFSGAIALRPQSMLAHLKRGDTYRRRGDLPAALRDLRRAAALDPSAPAAAELLGDVNLAMGRYQRAVEDYRRGVGLEDRAPRVLYKLGLALYRNGQTSAAIEQLRRAIAVDDRLPEAHYLLGVAYRDARNGAEGTKALNTAVSLNPAFTAAREQLAALYGEMGRRRDQMEQLEALAALEPERPERLVSVALAYAYRGRVDAAVLALGRAAERYPQAGIVSAALGRVWLDVAEARNDDAALRSAIAALEEPARRGDAGSELLTLYGRALIASGELREAERVLQAALQRPPVHREAFTQLARVARELGHEALAASAAAGRVALP